MYNYLGILPFLTGSALAVEALRSMSSALALANHLQVAADQVPEDPVTARFLSTTAESIYMAAQAGQPTSLRDLEGPLSNHLKAMDEATKNRLIARLRSVASYEGIRQTLTTMTREGRWREVGTLLSEQPAEVLREFSFMPIRFSLALEEANFRAAEEILNEMNAIQPQHPRTYLYGAELELAQGDIESADELYDSAWDQAGQHQEFRRSLSLFEQFCSVCIRIFLAQGNLNGAQSQMDEWLMKNTPETLADRYYLQGLIYEKRLPRGSRSAIPSMEEAVKIFPQRTDFQMALARLHFRKKESDQAKTVLETLRKLDPLNPNIWVEIASLYMEMHDTQSAAHAYFKAATLLNPNEKRFSFAGLAFILAHAVNDVDLVISCENFLRDMAFSQNLDGTGSKPTPAALTILPKLKAAQEMRGRLESAEFSDEALRFGTALEVVLDFNQSFLKENVNRFDELAWGVGGRFFTHRHFDAVMTFLLDLKNTPSKAQLYARGEALPKSWSLEEPAIVLEALRIANREKNYEVGTRLARTMLHRFGMKMFPKTLQEMNRWLIHFVFHWAFEGVPIEAQELKSLLKDYLSSTLDREQLNYVEIFARRYKHWPQVADRLLTLRDTDAWRSARSVRDAQQAN